MKIKIINQIVNFEFYQNQPGRSQPILVFLHGWQRSLGDFRLIAEDLRRRGFSVLILDLPGFGQSSLPTNAWNIEEYADFLKIFFEKFIASYSASFPSGTPVKFGIIGHSFGGRLAIKFASKYPSFVQKLVLVASGGLKHKSVKNFVYKIISKIVKIILNILRLNKFKEYLKHKFSSEDYLEARGILKDIFIKAIQEDLTADATKIQASTLIIWGEDDSELPVQDAFLLQKAIRNSQVKIFENAGHFVFLEEPQKFTDVIGSFFK